jgi:transposase
MARAAWSEEIVLEDIKQLVFVDESSTHTSLTRLYGWAPHDQRAHGQVPRNHGKNTTFIAALTWHGVQAPWALEGAMDGDAFHRYITQVLCPTLHPGQVVVLDNLTVHKSVAVAEALAACGCRICFLPAYSPDFTPIEQVFSKVKAILRKLGSRTHEALIASLAQAIDAISPADAAAWFRHAGYSFPAP